MSGGNRRTSSKGPVRDSRPSESNAQAAAAIHAPSQRDQDAGEARMGGSVAAGDLGA